MRNGFHPYSNQNIAAAPSTQSNSHPGGHTHAIADGYACIDFHSHHSADSNVDSYANFRPSYPYRNTKPIRFPSCSY